MFGRQAKGAGRKVRADERRSRKTVQDAIPLADIKNGVVYRSDGNFVVFVEVEGTNYSIHTVEQMERDALKDAEVLSAINQRYSIMVYPRPVSAQASLVEINRAIDQAAAEAASGTAGATWRHALLCEHAKAEAEAEAAGADRIELSTCIGFEFKQECTPAEALRQVNLFCKIAEDKTRSRPRILTTTEAIELIELWTTPGYADATKPIWMNMPLPIRGSEEGR